MRKLLVLTLLAGLTFMISAPVFAIDQETDARIKALEDRFGAWTLYGSARYESFYQKTDKNYDDGYLGIGMVPDNKITDWGLSSISRVGAKVQKGSLGARVELGLNDSSPTTRLMYGTYTSGDLTIIFGHDWAPLSDWAVSNQQYWGENDLAGWGVMDRGRASQVKFRYKGLEVALVKPVAGDILSSETEESVVNKTDILLPIIEARYQLDLVPDKLFIQPFAGAETYKITLNDAAETEKNITPWTAGLNAGINVKPVYLNLHGWYALNGKDMGLNIDNAVGAYWDATANKVINEKSMGGAVVLGAAIDKYTIEAGWGYVSSKWDDGPGGTDKDKVQSYYLNMTIPLVGDNFFVVPEIGVVDQKDDERISGEGNGKVTYAGAKWQLNF